MIRRTTILIALVGLCFSPNAAADVPGQIHYQGTLRDAQGALVHCPSPQDCPSGSVTITFRLYAAAVDGDSLWQETFAGVSVNQGAVDLNLGQANPIEPSALGGAEAYLALEINDGGELSPRQKVVATAYALVAAQALDAISLGGQPAEAYVTEDAIPGLCITEDALMAYGYMQTADLAGYLTENGYVAGPSLADLACAANEGPVWDGDSWQCAIAGLSPDAIAIVSNGLISNQFVDTFSSVDTPVDIFDNNPVGVASEIAVPDVGIAQALNVTIEVTNSNFSAVTVRLFDANNIEHILFDGGNVDGTLQATFPDPTPPVLGDLEAWVGLNPAGTWRLEVVDNDFLNNGIDGQIVSWSIEMHTLSNEKIEVKGDLIVSGTVTGAGGLDIDGDMKVDGDLDLKGNQLKNARIHVSAVPPAACDANSVGLIYFDLTDKVLRVCIDDEFQAISSGVCGDGKIQGAEDCDDGNAINADGCNAACQTEPGYVCTSVPSQCAAKTCLDILAGNPFADDGNYFIDPTGGDPADAVFTFCNMSSPHGAPDYKLITPDQFYHADQFQKYGATNGVNVFDYNCDGCAAAFFNYDYYCPDPHWTVHFALYRSHCNHSNHDGNDGVFVSETISNGAIEGRGFRQHSDGCGDPNEFTIVAACRIKGTQAVDPGDNVWNTHFRDVNWSN